MLNGGAEGTAIRGEATCSAVESSLGSERATSGAWWLPQLRPGRDCRIFVPVMGSVRDVPAPPSAQWRPCLHPWRAPSLSTRTHIQRSPASPAASRLQSHRRRRLPCAPRGCGSISISANACATLVASPHMYPQPRVPKATAPSNNAMHQTRRGGVAHFVRREPVVEARLAGDCECYAGTQVAS